MSPQSSGESLTQHVSRRRDRCSSGFGPSVLRRVLSCITHGSLVVETPSGDRVRHEANQEGPEGLLILHRWRALRRLATKGDVGFAEGYIEGDWSSPDLTALIELASTNAPALEQQVQGLALLRGISRLSHMLRANTIRGSRRNIAFHYDLGNDFYSLWLDPTMTYSSAFYASGASTLEQAQEAKLNRILELLDIRPGNEILEIGCGWGALAGHLAMRNGTRVTALTLSRQQRAYSLQKHQEIGLSSQIDVQLRDYRDARGHYDRIVSIEMMEAVGEAYWPVYFSTIRDRLSSAGRAVLQVITIDEARFEHYRAGADFIQSYIFPGGMLPSKTALRTEIERAGLQLVSEEVFGQSYAQTLAEWRIRFHRAWPEIQKLGFDGRFRRLWDYYLCYCEAGFRAGAIDVGLYVVTHEQ